MKELELVQNEIKNGLIDPFKDNSLKSFLFNGSKLIRSKLAIYFIKSNNIEFNSNICKILSAGELIHNASLLHDDVLDGANFRRGCETIGSKHSPHTSILAGNHLLAVAIEKLLELKNFDILEKFQECTKIMNATEINQYFLRGTIPTLKEYLDICYGKTGILFSTILECIEIENNNNPTMAIELGKKYGVYFQIRNDLKKESAKIDKLNKIYTIENILGIEKTSYLLDNYREEILSIISTFPNKKYGKEFEDLLTK
jgi:octaprenyl-diphosphate synthase